MDIGKDHGAFLNNGEDCVRSFLHKQTEESLRESGAVNEQGYVDLDTGAILFPLFRMTILKSILLRRNWI